jgi:hypothetical protein
MDPCPLVQQSRRTTFSFVLELVLVLVQQKYFVVLINSTLLVEKASVK